MTTKLQISGRGGRSQRIAEMTDAARILAAAGVIQCNAEDETLSGRSLLVNGRTLLHFGNCSYLGLEMDARLKAGACRAIERYGTQFSSSRSFCSVPLYREFECLLSELVGGHPLVVAPTTTLAHTSALPVLVDTDDVVLFDEHVHHSVRAALPQLGLAPSACRAVKHNCYETLDKELSELTSQGKRVFYLCDGVYSMQGDLVDVERLEQLLEKFPTLHVYVDDAHGVAWTGKNGAGVVLGRGALHARMIVVLGLAKGFGASGAVVVCPNQEWATRIFSCGSGLVFSGPMQPAQLGAGIEAARILLSEEVAQMQEELRLRITTFDRLCRDAGIPAATPSVSPIRFIPVGDERRALELCSRLQRAGCFTNLAIFPAVPAGCSGIRVVLTRHLEIGDVEHLVSALRALWPEVVQSPPVAA